MKGGRRRERSGWREGKREERKEKKFAKEHKKNEMSCESIGAVSYHMHIKTNLMLSSSHSLSSSFSLFLFTAGRLKIHIIVVHASSLPALLSSIPSGSGWLSSYPQLLPG